MRVQGLPPIYDADSRVLVLGTIPSEKSREEKAYYANKSNRFWKVVCDHIGISIPASYDARIACMQQNNIALWDLIESCEMVGSKNSTIKDPTFNDLSELLNTAKIELIILNGEDAHKYYEQHFNALRIDYVVVPNTSSRNSHFDEDLWDVALLNGRIPISKAMKRYIQLCGNNPFYKIETTPTEHYVFDDMYALPKARQMTGLTVQHKSYLNKALVAHINNKWHLYF